MSRVDEAIRRASGLSVRRSAEERLPTDTPAFEEALSGLAGEAFPMETLQLPSRPAAPAKLSAPSATAEVGPPFLLERIDPQFAQKVVVDRRVMPASREQYRRLAAALHHAQGSRGIKVVMIASAASGEGKTLTASNLALTFSESYQRSVMLIDADLRKPAIHTVFGLDNTSGLMEGLSSVEERQIPVRQVSPRLTILPAGVAAADPMASLTSTRMRRLLDEARKRFDWVVIDTPPVVFLTDANLLADMVDAAVVVVKAGATSYDMVRRAVDAIGMERIIGVVLNRSETVADAPTYTYYESQYRTRSAEGTV